MIIPLEIRKMLIDDLEQRAFVKQPWPISRVVLLHKNRAKQESCLDGSVESENRQAKPAKGLAGL